MKNLICSVCGKNIDTDTYFCKHCGANALLNNKENLEDIFSKVLDTLCKNSKLPYGEAQERLEQFNCYENKELNDNDYYRILVEVVFYSGFRAATVNKHLDAIHRSFPDYKSVSKYSQDVIGKISVDPDMIKNKRKINACVKNAKVFAQIVNEHGSFQSFIDSYRDNVNDEWIYNLRKHLIRKFLHIGAITSYHFLTEIGFNVLKPDRVILRIFSRLGLIDKNYNKKKPSRKTAKEAIGVGRAFSQATGFKIRYIDIVFVSYGQLDSENFECICSDENPKCNDCGIKSYCLHTKICKTQENANGNSDS
jgi:DNA-3-methyladenine glycosylase I